MGNRESQFKNLKKSFEILEPKDKPHILEFGVAAGRSLKYITEFGGDNYKYYGFDSFIGLLEDWKVTKDEKNKLVAPSSSFCYKGNIPDIPNVKFFKGFFNETLPDYLEIAENIALLHMDVDLYSSAKEVLLSLNDFIVPGTVIVFDEWVYNHNKYYDDHEAKAFYEWVEEKNREYLFIDFLGEFDSQVIDGEWVKQDVEQKTVKIVK